MTGLNRQLGPWSAASIVVGTIIGTGIFLKAAPMAQQVGGAGAVMAAWALSGILSYAGALTYAEMCARLPRAGGEYALLKESIGPKLAFSYGWTRFWIGAPGSIAAYAVGAATFLGGLWALPRSALAIAFIAFFTAINCLNLRWGSGVQNFLTGLKVLLIAALVVGVFFLGAPYAGPSTAQEFPAGAGFASAFGLAMISALWAFDGWNNLPMVSEEVQRPQRNIPLALGLGLLVVLALYLGANSAYFHVLSAAQVQAANSTAHPDALPVATSAASTFMGDWSVPALSIAFAISALGAMNGSILTGARVPFAMARDGLFPKFLAHAHQTSHVPVRSILVQGLVSSGLALTGTFDKLTDYVVVAAAWLYYALTTVGLFTLRRKKIGEDAPFRVPGYPVVPALFVLAALCLIGNSAYRSPMEALIGLGLIALGMPFYFFFFLRGGTPLKLP